MHPAPYSGMGGVGLVDGIGIRTIYPVPTDSISLLPSARQQYQRILPIMPTDCQFGIPADA
jgi:hypothetical protein